MNDWRPEQSSVEVDRFFALRTPLLPFDALENWSSGCTVDLAVADANPAAIGVARARLVERLKVLIARADIMEALFLASPSIVDDINRWCQSDKSDEKVERAVVRYFQRMCGRATPFGAFAGCSTGEIRSTSSRLRLSPAFEYGRHSRLDNLYTFHFADVLGRQPSIRAWLRYTPNTTLVRLAGRWQFIARTQTTESVSYELVAVDADRALEELMEFCRDGRSIAEMEAFLVRSEDPPLDSEALEYITTLIDWQLLTDDLVPPLTGLEPLESLSNRLALIPAASVAYQTIETIRSQLAQLDKQGLGVAPAGYSAIQGQIHKLDPESVSGGSARCFQVDLVKPGELVLSTKVAKLVKDGISLLHRIGEPSQPDPLRQFKKDFVARYERREVLLLEALNPEAGIGFERTDSGTLRDEPLLADLLLPSVEPAFQPEWTGREQFMLSELHRLWREGAREWHLSDHDIEALTRPQQPPLPRSFTVLASIANQSSIDDDAVVFMKQIHGPSGANFLGRFCHADPSLRERVVEHLEQEECERPDAIFAEIVHVPAGRLANILSRPLLRKFEIPYLGRSGATERQQIGLSDLLVSVKHDRVILRSKAHGREVLPRLSTMHNFRTGQRIYDFLATLQNQDVLRWLRWEWGVLQSAPFLPRVSRGSLVLARAKWTLSAKQLRSLTEGSESQRVKAALALRETLNLPRFVVLIDADQEMPVDFENVLSVETFVHMATGRTSASLAEMWGANEERCVTSDEGTFVNEIVIPILAATPKAPRISNRSPQEIDHSVCERVIPPFARWTYLNLFAGRAMLDRLLAEPVSDLIERLRTRGAVTEWFFVRYSEPSWHLRLRLLSPDAINTVMPELGAFLQGLVAAGLVYRVQVDTYHREIERYGGPAAIALVERIFWYDSEAMLAALRASPGRDARWLTCFRSWAALLNDFGLTEEQKFQCVANQAALMKELLKFDKIARLSLGRKFRSERSQLERILQPSGDHEDDHIEREFRKRSAGVRPIVEELRALSTKGALTSSVEEIVPSLLHMNANRLLRSGHRWQEAVLYDFLERTYGSSMARQRRVARS